MLCRRQAYTFIKGHYIPIILNDVSDESEMSVDKRKYYIQNYTFLMMGFLMDEEEFIVAPGITRALTMVEVAGQTGARKAKGEPPRPNNFDLNFRYVVGNSGLTETFAYTADIVLGETYNVDSYSVYINGDYVGDDISTIQISTGDILNLNVVKSDGTKESIIESEAFLV